MTSITIGSGVTNIGAYAFYGCNSLTTIYGITCSYAQTYASENGYTFVAMYKVTVASATGGSVSADYTSAVPGTTVTLTVNPDLGYKLLGWTGNISIDANNQFVMPGEDVTIEPTFVALEKHNIYYSIHGSGIVLIDKSSTYAGDIVTVTVLPDQGYELADIQFSDGDITLDANNQFIMPDDEISVHVYFAPVNYEVTVTSSTGGSASANQSIANMGDTITLTATPDTGYRLREWIVAAGDISIDENNQFVMPAESVSVQAVFELVYALTTDNYIDIFYYDDSYSQVFVTEGTPGEEYEVQIKEDAVAPTGKYFTGEFLLDEVSLGSDSYNGYTWYETVFTMPNHAATVTAVLADQTAVTYDLDYGTRTEITQEAFILLQSSENITSDVDEYGREVYDINSSGTNDLIIHIEDVLNSNDEIIETNYYIEILNTFDVQEGSNVFNFTGNMDCYSSITLNFPTKLLVGDLDFDGVIDINDIGAVISASAGNLNLTEVQEIVADYNLDGAVDGFDAAELDRYVYSINTAKGDVNQDGDIGLADYAMTKAHISGVAVDNNTPANLLDKSYLTSEYDSIKDNYPNGTIITQQYYCADYDGDKAVDAFDLFYLDKRINNIA